MPTPQHLDVLIIGAGLSGIGAAYRLQTECKGKSYAILEGRSASGGTWDLFRYPGIRSDSDMFTLGYSFRPWKGAKAIADGADILEYLRATARDEDVERHIRFGHRLLRASWDSASARWTRTRWCCCWAPRCPPGCPRPPGCWPTSSRWPNCPPACPARC